MRAAKPRLSKIESELRFQVWLEGSRTMEGFSTEQLLAYAERCEIPDPLPPLKQPSKYDGLSRKALRKLWEQSEAGGRKFQFEQARIEEVLFYVRHGYFPDEVEAKQELTELEQRANQIEASPRRSGSRIFLGRGL